MKEHSCQEQIHILTEYSQKIQWEKELRFLWKSCFGDPQYYEDFYFDKVYADNKVYAIKDKGMIHLNFYRCKVMGKDVELPYIVGVATNENCRRQGIMRSLLEQVLFDLNEQRVPFAYLMPANEEYYKPFGFQSVSEKVECEIWMKDAERTSRFRYLSYGEFKKLSSKVQAQLREEINQWLEQRYDVYAVHDEAYYELLYAEKKCQNGNVVFCFDGVVDVKSLYGMFAYAMDGNIPYVEQMVLKEKDAQDLPRMTGLIASFFAECDSVKLVQSYPYMFRIINRNAFVELFEEKCSDVAGFAITDSMTCDEMIEHLFIGKDSVYFAEIV